MGTASEDWTIESELCRLSGKKNILEAAHALNLIPPHETDLSINTDDKWTRTDADTYVYRFWINLASGTRSGFVITACATTNLAVGVAETVKKWVVRREQLERSGVSVPQLYFAGEGVALYELVPDALEDVLRQHPDKLQSALGAIIHIIETCVELGFSPRGLFDSLRMRGGEVVAVDFGDDLLGSGLLGDNRSQLIDEFLLRLKQWGVPVSVDAHRTLMLSKVATRTRH